MEPSPEGIAGTKSSNETEYTVSSKMLEVELQLNKARLKKEQLEKERQRVDEDFRQRIEVADVEIATALSQLESLQGSIKTRGATSEPKASNYLTVHNQMTAACSNDRRNFKPSSPILESSHSDRASSSSTAGPMLTPGAPPPAPIVFNSIGLEQLSVLDCVSIRQLRSESVEETYEVVAPGEDLVIFRVNATFHLMGSSQAIDLEFIDNQVKEVMVFKIGAEHSMELSVCGRLASVVKKASTYFKPMLVVHDARGAPVLKVKASSHLAGQDFHVQTISKKKIGYLKKILNPTTQYEAPHAILKFPLDLDVRFKAALIASNFLIVDEKTSEIRERKRELLRRQSSVSNTDYPRC